LLYDILYMWLVSAAMLWIVHRHVVGASYFAGIPIHRGFDGLVQLRHAHLSALRPENYCVLVRNVKSHQREAPDLLRFFQSVFQNDETVMTPRKDDDDDETSFKIRVEKEVEQSSERLSLILSPDAALLARAEADDDEEEKEGRDVKREYGDDDDAGVDGVCTAFGLVAAHDRESRARAVVTIPSSLGELNAVRALNAAARTRQSLKTTADRLDWAHHKFQLTRQCWCYQQCVSQKFNDDRPFDLEDDGEIAADVVWGRIRSYDSRIDHLLREQENQARVSAIDGRVSNLSSGPPQRKISSFAELCRFLCTRPAQRAVSRSSQGAC
jgi:hypothetical protein